MSRARIVRSRVVNRIPTIGSAEELTVVSEQNHVGRRSVYNLNKDSNLQSGNTLNSSNFPAVVKSDMNVEYAQEQAESVCKKLVNNWLNKSDIAMNVNCDGFLEGPGLDIEQNIKKNSRSTVTSDNLVLNNSVDPLLNVTSEVSDLTFSSGDTAKESTVTDCDISNYKSKIWDTLSIASRKSESDKNSDFIDFNLLPFTFDQSDLIECVDEKDIENTTITYEFDSNGPFDSMLIQEAKSIDFNKSLKVNNTVKSSKTRLSKVKRQSDGDPMLTIPAKMDKNMNVDEIYGTVISENDETQDATMFNINTTEDPNDSDFNLSTEDLTAAIEPILNGSLDNFNETLSEHEARIMKSHKISELANMVGLNVVVSNLTVNSNKPRTKLLVKTDKGEERYEGYTEDLMLPLSNQKKDKNPPAPVIGNHIITSVETAATIREGPNTPWYRHDPEDELIKNMLDVLGISDDMLYTILTNLNLRVWVCPEHECRKIYNKLHMLKTHILGHYGLKPFKCDYPNCPWSFYTSFKLKRHKETHEKKKNFVCTVPDCNRSFTTVYNLNTHIKRHERPARLKCLVGSCEARFQTIRAMEKHLKTHKDCLAPYKCDHPGCEKLCYSSSALTAHARCHSHKPEELTCRFCNRVFDKPCRLKAHLRQHTGDRPYICQYKDCDWAFSSSSKLKRHQHKHFGERKFRCTIGDCNKAFMRSEHLKDHTLTHIGSKQFQCPVCEETFTTKAAMYVHKKKFHSKTTGTQDMKAKPSKTKKDSLDVKENKPVTHAKAQINRKNTNIKNNAKAKPCTITKPEESTQTLIMDLKLERPDNSVSMFESNILQPSSPVTLSNLTTDDYEFDSFKQAFSSLEHIEPVISNPVETTEKNKPNNKTCKGTKNKNAKKSAKKKGFFSTTESCARTYLPYKVNKNPNALDSIEFISSDESNSLSALRISSTNMKTTEVCSESPIPGPSHISEMSLSSLAELQPSDMGPMAQEFRDSLIDNDSTAIAYNCDTNISDASSELLINYDNFQESQQPIFFSNFILQDTDNGTDLFTSEDNEYVLFLDSTTSGSSSFPESTINLRDLD